jgi:hypothetical protein
MNGRQVVPVKLIAREFLLQHSRQMLQTLFVKMGCWRWLAKEAWGAAPQAPLNLTLNIVARVMPNI